MSIARRCANFLSRPACGSANVAHAHISDRHGIFRINHPGAGKINLTQFVAAIGVLDIELICAKSPQAKGRVERVNRTLQDRLVKALRLANIDSLEAGKAFLESYRERSNAHFAEAPRDVVDVHRPISGETTLALFIVRRTQRKVTKDLAFFDSKAIPPSASVIISIMASGKTSRRFTLGQRDLLERHTHSSVLANIELMV